MRNRSTTTRGRRGQWNSGTALVPFQADLAVCRCSSADHISLSLCGGGGGAAGGDVSVSNQLIADAWHVALGARRAAASSMMRERQRALQLSTSSSSSSSSRMRNISPSLTPAPSWKSPSQTIAPQLTLILTSAVINASCCTRCVVAENL